MFSIYLSLTCVCIILCLILMVLDVRPTSTFARRLIRSCPILCLQAFICQIVHVFYYIFGLKGAWDNGRYKFAFGWCVIWFAVLIGCHMVPALRA